MEKIKVPQTYGRQELVILLATKAVVLALGVLHQSLLAYILLPQGRGAYALCLLFGLLLGTFFTPGAGRGSQYLVMAGRISLSEGVFIALTISVAGGVLAAICGVPLIFSGLSLFEQIDPQLFLLALVKVPTTACASAMALLLDGRRRFASMAAFSSLRSAVMVIAFLVLVWGLGLGVGGAIIALVINNLFFIAVCIVDLRKNCGLVWELPTRCGLARTIGYGLRHHVVQVGAIADDRLGSLLLGLTSSQASVGYFSAGSALMRQALALPSVIATAVQPRIADAEAGRPELTAFCARVAWWTTGAVLLALLALSDPLIRFMLSEAFSPVVSLMWILALGMVVYSGSDLFMAYFRGTNRPQVCSCAILMGLAVNAFSFFILFPLAGFEAAAWAMTGGLVVRGVFLLAVFCRTTGMGLLATCFPRASDLAFVWREAQSLLRRPPATQTPRNKRFS